MLDKKNKKLSGYVFISITSIILVIASITSAIVFYQKENLTHIQAYQELRELNEQLYALQQKTLGELEINILQKKHFDRNMIEEVIINGENNFQHFVSIQPLDGCLNLTALIYKDLNGKFKSLALEKERFQHIFRALDLNEDWVNILIDYQDSDFDSSSFVDEKEKEYKNLPLLHLSEVYDIIDLTPSQKKLFHKNFCVNQIDRKFNIMAMQTSQIAQLFPFLNPRSFEEYLNNHDYQNLNSLNDWQKFLIQFLERSLTPKEIKFLNAVSLENKTLEMLVRSSKKGLNWKTKMKFEMKNQDDVMVAYQLGPYVEQ